VSIVDVQFRHGDDVLAGTLYGPAGPGRHPAVALVYGSGKETRDYDGMGSTLARHFARNGFACLTWDKPGCGKSTGDFNKQTLPDRAEEALAAVRFLRARDDVQPDRVGLWGHSQGGIVIPQAAALSGEVAFLIEVSGWQGPGWEQDIVRVEAELRAAGFLQADIDEATAFARRRMDMIRGTGSFGEFDKIQNAAKSARWFGHVHYCDRTLFYSGRRTVGFDTGPAWEKVHCPVLAIYGGKDRSSGPEEPLVEIIRRGLAKAGNADFTVKIFPDADHSICQSQPGGSDFAPGFLETMTNWLTKRFGG